MTITDGKLVNISKMACSQHNGDGGDDFEDKNDTMTIKLFALNTMVMVMMMLKTRMMT